MKQTSLHAVHTALGALFTDFAGWSMPMRYASELAEHKAVREAAGLFDLSHMAEIHVRGPQAADVLDFALVGNLSGVKPGRARYTMICDADGGVLDDLVVYRLADEEYLVVANAGNADVVAAALAERVAGFDAVVDDRSEETALLAVQGPKAVEILGAVTDADLGALKYYASVPAVVRGHSVLSVTNPTTATAETGPYEQIGCSPCPPTSGRISKVLLARTGYTGEDGFELYVPAAEAPSVWRILTEAGDPHGLVPAGLACRDTLRLEAGMPLYGNELSLRLSPFEAGLGRVVKFEKPGDFVGRAALEELASADVPRVRVGLRGTGRRAPRHGYRLLDGDTEIGEVTSGALSPTLGYPIAMAYVDRAYTEPGTKLSVDIRGRIEPVEVVALPFYSRA